jgi:hypothetical protein
LPRSCCLPGLCHPRRARAAALIQCEQSRVSMEPPAGRSCASAAAFGGAVFDQVGDSVTLLARRTAKPVTVSSQMIASGASPRTSRNQ